MKQKYFVLPVLCLIAFVASAQPPTQKSLQDLLASDNSTWKRICLWQSNADNLVEILPADSMRAANALVKTQVAANTFLGSIIYNSGGILIDNGWIRILGSGCSRLDRSVPDWNKNKLAVSRNAIPIYLLVADDVLGGLFALKSETPGEPDSVGVIFYYGPNSLSWQSTGLTYSNFLSYCFSGNLQDFYDGFQWKGWQDDIKQISCNQVYSCYPLLWTREGIEMKSNRKVLAIQKQWDLYYGKPLPPKQKAVAARPAPAGKK